MKKYLPITLTLAVVAGAALTSIPASAAQGTPGYSSDGAVVATPNNRQHQVRARSISVAPKYDWKQESGIAGYSSDGAVVGY
jgi:hypothetical protein